MNSSSKWRVQKMSWLFGQISSGTTPDTNDPIYYREDIPWINTGDLNDGPIEYTTRKISKKALMDYSALKIYPKHSLIIAMYGATIGKLGITRIKATTNQACCVLSYPQNIDIKFVFYWFISNRVDIIHRAQGGGQPNINQNIIKGLRIRVPSIQMQNIISKFLDSKTSEIDSLIADKKKLIDLLEEQRQAIITEAVTKGLDPNVKMKDSGVEWIGEIPEHWEIKKLKYIAKVNLSNIDKKTNKDDEPVFLCNYLDVYSKNEINRKLKFMRATAKEEQIKKFTLQKGDVIITKDSESPSDIAVPSYVEESMKRVVCGYHLALIKPIHCNGLYLYYAFKCNKVREQFYNHANGVTRFGLSKNDISSGIFTCPDAKEQEKIALYLHEVNKNITRIVNIAKKQIVKFKEYRQSLIYEAVTGKIDVRDYKKEEALS